MKTNIKYIKKEWMQRATKRAKLGFAYQRTPSTSNLSTETTPLPSRRSWAPSHKSMASPRGVYPLSQSTSYHSAGSSARTFYPSPADLDPHNNTTGRWLRHDKLERDSRKITFDFNALCDKVLGCSPGSSSISKYEKKEGNYNKIFIFTCDNSMRIVARLPTSISGPPKLTTHSEVATISYLQSQASVPIPRILDWSDDASNPVGSEYIVMEEVPGTQLQQAWPNMSGEQKISCIHSICMHIQQIARIEFPAYGSLYFSDLFVEPAYKRSFDDGFCVGPHCGTAFWDCNAGETRYYHLVKPNRGPWSSLVEYSNGLIDTGISRLPPDEVTPRRRPPYLESVAEHLQLLKYGREIINMLSQDVRIQQNASPTLYHADLHMRNIFVSQDDPTIVTGIIDWQSSSIEPAFVYAEATPDFADSSKNLASEDEIAEFNAKLCRQAFDACIQGLVPRLGSLRMLDCDLLRPFRYCHRTWKDGAVAFKHELVEISRRWNEFKLASSCPYPMPTSGEMEQHQRNYKTLETAYTLKNNLMAHLNVGSDG